MSSYHVVTLSLNLIAADDLIKGSQGSVCLQTNLITPTDCVPSRIYKLRLCRRLLPLIASQRHFLQLCLCNVWSFSLTQFFLQQMSIHESLSRHMKWTLTFVKIFVTGNLIHYLWWWNFDYRVWFFFSLLCGLVYCCSIQLHFHIFHFVYLWFICYSFQSVWRWRSRLLARVFDD